MSVEISAPSVVRIACLLLVGIVILNGIDTSIDANSEQKYNITITGNPLDGDTITFDANVFEFDTGNGVATGHIPVIIGTSIDNTTSNLSAAFTAYGYEVSR